MAEILAEHSLGFAYDPDNGVYVNASNPSLFTPIEGVAYRIVWDGTEHVAVAFTHAAMPGMVLVGNTLIVGGENTGEPFAICSKADGEGMSIFTFDANDTHTIAVHLYEEEPEEPEQPEEPSGPAGVSIVLYDRAGEPVTYEGIETITTDTPNAGEVATFTHGVLMDGVEIELAMAGGDQKISVPDGYLVKKATLKKPETLLPEHIKKNVEIAGVVGEFAGDMTEKIVPLNMANGNQEIIPEEDAVFSKVTVIKPDTLVPENIKKNIDIGGVVGEFSMDTMEKNVELALADGDQVIEADEDTAFSKVTIVKPESLVPENIKRGKNIGGVVGTCQTSHSVIDPEWLEKICFWDIDGTMLYQYSISEAANLDSLPSPPTHEGLTFQGWNYTLDEVKNAGHILDVGAIYIPNDGNTHVKINITNTSYKALPVCFSQTVSNGVTIDWGDGSTQTVSGTGKVSATHTYTNLGEYELIFSVSEGCTMTLGHGTSSTVFIGKGTSNYKNYVTAFYIGNNVIIGDYGINNNQNIERLTIPEGVESIGQYGCASVLNLYALIFPKSLKTLGSYATNNTCGQSSKISHLPISLPNGLENIGDGNISSANANRLVLPDSLLSIGSYSINGIQSCVKIYMPDGVQSIGSNSLQNGYYVRECPHIPSALKSLPGSFLYYYQSIEEIVIPEGVENIGNSCIYNCTGVKKVVLPESLKTIGSGFLASCSNLKTLVVKSSLESCATTSFSGVYIEEYIFTNPNPSAALASQFNTRKCTIYVPDEAVEQYNSVISSMYRKWIRPLSEYKGTID